MNAQELAEYTESCLAIQKGQESFGPLAAEGQAGATVVVVTYKRFDMLRSIMEQLLNQDYPNLEIIIVDSSPDAQKNFNKLNIKEDKRLTYIVSHSKYICAVRNIGLLAARGKIVIFVDDDVYIDTDFVSRHVALHLSQEGKDAKLVSGHCIARPCEPIEWARHHVYYRPEGRWAKGVYGVNFSVKKERVIQCKGFNPYIPNIGDETELFTRMISRPKEALNGKEVVLVHRCALTGGSRPEGKDPKIMALTMSSRILSKLSNTPSYSLIWLFPRQIARSIVYNEITHFFSMKGLGIFMEDFIWYCLSSSFRLKKRDQYFKKSLQMAKPRIIYGTAIPLLPTQES